MLKYEGSLNDLGIILDQNFITEQINVLFVEASKSLGSIIWNCMKFTDIGALKVSFDVQSVYLCYETVIETEVI